MYTIEKKSFGYIIIFDGNIEASEMQQWYDDSLIALENEYKKSFGVIIDMQALEQIDSATRIIVLKGQKLYKDNGMNKSAVILNDAELCQQLKNVALQSGIYSTERYIDASSITNPVEVATKWVKDSIDPDK